MSDPKDQTLAFNVRLKPSESSAHPRVTNYTNVVVAQGIAYFDFGFIEPTCSPRWSRRQGMAKRRYKNWRVPSSHGWP